MFSTALSHSLPSLHEAARDGNLDVLKLHLDNGIDVNLKNAEGVTPLQLAVTHGHVAIVHTLLTQDADTRSHGHALLAFALETYHHEMVATLLAAGVDRYLQIPAWKNPTECLERLLFAATKAGHKELVQALLEQGVNVEAKDSAGHTPLVCAVAENQAAIVELLMDAGANPNAQDRYGLTALALAARYNRKQIFELMLAKGAEVNALGGQGRPALYYAVEYERLELVKMLLERGAKLNLVGFGDNTVLMLAAMHGNKGLIELLLAHGAEVNAKNYRDESALVRAVIYNHPAVVEILLEAGAELEATNEFGLSVLTLALAKGCKSIVQLLLAKGAMVTGTAPPPLVQAVVAGNHKDIISLLIAYGADVDATVAGGPTVLSIAVAKHRYDLAAIFLAHGALNRGASLYRKNQEGKTVFDYQPAWRKEFIDEFKQVIPKNAWHKRRHLICCYALRRKFTSASALIKAGNTLEAIAEIKSSASLCKYQEQASGNTLLHIAAIEGNLSIIQALIHQGIDSTLKNKTGQLASDLLAKPAQAFMQALLKERASLALDYVQVLL